MLIESLKLKFNIVCFQQFPTSSSPGTLLDLHGNLSHLCSPPCWGKMMMIRFGLNRFFLIWQPETMLSLSHSTVYAIHSAAFVTKGTLLFIVCETWLLCAAD